MLFLFDVDGTLVMAGGAGRRALDRAFELVLGLPGATEGIRLDGMTDPLILEETFRLHLGRSPEAHEAAAILDAYVELLEGEVARADNYQVMPGVAEALDVLGAGGHLSGLATGNIEAGARIKLTRGGLWDRFPFGGYGSDAAARAEVVAHAIVRGEAKAGRRFAPAEVLVIGDTPRDVAAAHACGVRAIAVATGWHPAEALAACDADVVLSTLEELPGWLGEPLRT